MENEDIKKDVQAKSDEILQDEILQTDNGGSSEENDDQATELDIETQLAEAKAEALENHMRLLRVSAEFDNYKKRADRQMDGLRKYANEDLLRRLLPVIDNLERALHSAPEEEQEMPIGKGVKLTLQEMVKVLKGYDVKPVRAMGESFDPNYHEAVMQEESELPENEIITEYQKGYLLRERLLRPAMVVVSKGPGVEVEKLKEE